MPMGKMERSVRTTLLNAGFKPDEEEADTAMALMLSKALDNSPETGVSSLVRELRSVLTSMGVIGRKPSKTKDRLEKIRESA
jgi:hypothetical protein